MNEATASQSAPWFVKQGSDEDTQSSDIRQLSESELQRVLRRAGDNLAKMFVKQGSSDWYPAKLVLKKFERLAKEGIYIRREGAVDGPYTAVRALELLSEMDVADVQAKVGIHADWVPAHRLLKVLRKTSQPTDEESVDQRSANSDEEVGKDALIDEQADEEIIDAEVIDEQPLIELVLVAEPVALPQNPPAPVEITPLPRTSTHTSPRRPNRHTPAKKTKRAHNGKVVLLSIAGVLGLLIIVGGVLWQVIGRQSSEDVTESNDNVSVASTIVQDVPDEPAPPAPANPDQPPPKVRPGTLYRPSIQTTMGEVTDGILFAARVGRSNRTVLVGAANLLGPDYGLTRQLRGAEVLLHFEGLRITDYVTEKTDAVVGKPVRLRSAEYPSISVHGDAVVFEPNNQLGLEPLSIVSKLPEIGDRVWLLGRATGGDSLVHAGRYEGVKDDWLLIRLDDQSLDLSGTSGTAVVNADHQVFGIKVASDQTETGSILIASPIKLIIPEIQ